MKFHSTPRALSLWDVLPQSNVGVTQ